MTFNKESLNPMHVNLEVSLNVCRGANLWLWASDQLQVRLKQGPCGPETHKFNYPWFSVSAVYVCVFGHGTHRGAPFSFNMVWP